MDTEKVFCDIAPLEGYPEPYSILLATLNNTSGAWKYQLGRPEPEVIVWQPYPGGHSIGSILLHLAQVEIDWVECVSLGREVDHEEVKHLLADQFDPYSGKWPTPPSESIDYYFDILDNARARTLEGVKSFELPEVTRDAGWGIVTLRWILAHLIWHEGYHGGQAVLLSEAKSRLL